MHIRPKNWGEFQHYKTRTPPWIKLHRELLDNRKFHCLPLASKALAPMLWLLASEDAAGLVRADEEGMKDIAFRLRLDFDDLQSALKPLIEAKFFEIIDPYASNAIAPREQKARPESEGEAETDSDARGREGLWREVWAAFQSWGRLPDTSTEARTRGAWDRLSGELPDHAALLAAIHAQGARLREGGGQRGGWATAPHNWLERDRGWAANVGQPNLKPVDIDAVRAAWDGKAALLIDALGDNGAVVFSAWFTGANFEPGPPTRIGLPNTGRRTQIENRFREPLRKAFGEVILEVAA